MQSDHRGAAAVSIDFDATYRRLAPRLERAVGCVVRAPRPAIQEACQIAWGLLVCADPPVATDSALAWLRTTAIREVVRAARRQRLELPLDDPTVIGEVIELLTRAPGPDQVAEQREQLAEVRHLPTRQRRMVWLQGLGYDYGEIAERTGDSWRTVDRQLRRAKSTLRERVAG
jgi:DNA-directed RNA polymerase specialized sigma24 family protein